MSSTDRRHEEEDILKKLSSYSSYVFYEGIGENGYFNDLARIGRSPVEGQ